MSWSLPENQPNGRSSQTFLCSKPWEPKHLIGKQAKKLAEFRDRDGISQVTASKYRSGECFCKVTISGRPSAVDATMSAMGEWLKECSIMHFDNDF